MKKILSVMALFVISLLLVSSAFAATAVDSAKVSVEKVLVNGEQVTDTVKTGYTDVSTVNAAKSVSVEEGETVKVEVKLLGTAKSDGKFVSTNNLEVSAFIKGYEYSDYESLTATTHMFDIDGNSEKTVSLDIDLPKKLENKVYFLNVVVYQGNAAPLTTIVKLNVEAPRHSIDIKEVELFPGSTVKAGHSVHPTVLLANYGDRAEEDVKVTVSIPALNVKTTKYVDTIREGNIEYVSVDEMFLPIPVDTTAGAYDIKVTVTYDDLRETVSKTGKINVVANKQFAVSDKLVLAVGPAAQNVASGKTATYGIALTNDGASSKAYTLEAVTGDWASVSFSDNLVVLAPGQSKVVYTNVAVAADAVAGSQVVSVAVKAGNKVLETVSLNANVVVAPVQESASLRNGLELALIALVVLLVLVGLIIGFSRLRKDDDEEQTYY